MYTFLFIVSFILHAISFFIIILLYYRLQQTRELERKQVNLLKDMEDVLSAYVVEMKEENELFLNKVKKEKQNPSEEQPSKPIQKSVENKKNTYTSINTLDTQLTNEDLSALLPTYKKEEITEEPKVTKVSKEEEESLFNLLPVGQQAKILHKNGLSIEEIAKKLSKGVTEIELFLKFNE
ncbi:hypothetical protein [Bacillus pinisoli]|uniref:hypothetical protein n=1 Tax=Bacillus pinisoli TaxID=2901866 RepID=UPI001FF34274|nr:hypothetical protein [Bacillus pinisoli]